MFHQFQAHHLCLDRCMRVGGAGAGSTFAIISGPYCWCSDRAPSHFTRQEDCNWPCPGFAVQICGGNGFFSYIASELQETAERSETVTAAAVAAEAAENYGPQQTVIISRCSPFLASVFNFRLSLFFLGPVGLSSCSSSADDGFYTGTPRECKCRSWATARARTPSQMWWTWQ